MLSTKELNNKRARKEAKRAAKRKAVFLGKLKNEKYEKRHALKERAMRVIMNNPVLMQKYVEHQAKIKAAAKENQS